ncbi:loner ISO1 [Loa loa]|uniref:Loner ISO1 n=1 Tax=Loa loa TaxID=7209 RepID=A0A1I7VHB4_LOALO|nr:loner ISO1 [Loa loa]EFO26104.1 loner ISO1 [Loa loa]
MLSEWRGPTISVRTLTSYEISDELCRRQLQVLERRYGGRLRAHTAATRIQRAFRQSCLLKQWKHLVLPIQNSAVCSRTDGSQGCNDVSKRDVCQGSNDVLKRDASFAVASNAQACLYRPSLTPVRPKNPSARIKISIPERGCKVPLAVGESIGSARFDSESPHRSAVECLSPRLSQRRIVTDVTHPTTHVWLPRSSAVTGRSNHSNSLPRLDKHATPCQVVSTSSNAPGVPDQRRRRQYRIALNFFNKKPTRGVQYLIEWGFVEDNSLAIANLLLHRRGLSKQMIGEYIGHLHSPFQSSVLSHFVDQIDLHGMEVDIALRHTLSFFRLPGEAQKIERIMQVFSAHYAVCNPDKAALFHSADTIFILAFAIVMLNTDLHSPNIKPSLKMKVGDFINNLRGIDAGYDIDRALLVRIYRRIRDSPFSTGSDHVSQVIAVDQSMVGKDKPSLAEPHRRLVCYCRLNQIIDRSKRQPANAHQREVFLFNDLLLIAKMASKRKSCCQYVLRTWMMLLGVRVSMFETPFYEYGIMVTLSDGQEIYFNSKNDDDRHRFVADIKESVAECAEMEAVRIDAELDKHSLISRSDGPRERDSGLSEMEGNTSNSAANTSPNTPQQALNLCSIRRLSFNSFDSGVIEESCESFSHSGLSSVAPLYPSKRLEAAI